MRPSNPELATRPAMPRKLAALMKTPARARPFWKPVTFDPAAKNSLVVFVRFAAHPVMPSVARMKTKKKAIAVVFGLPSDVVAAAAAAAGSSEKAEKVE